MKPGELHERMLEFASDVIGYTDQLPATYIARHIGRQLMRSVTSVGANYAEAQGAESKADFIHKMQISLKECRESHSWLRLLFIRRINKSDTLQKLLNESTQLDLILSKAVVTAKSRP